MNHHRKHQDNVVLTPHSLAHEHKLGSPRLTEESTYRRRVLGVIDAFHKEEQGAHSVLCRFLFHYFACEALARLLQGANASIRPQKALEKRSGVNLNSLNAALRQFGLRFSKNRLKRIFEAKWPNYERASARRLRDRLVHQWSALAIAQLSKRGDRLVLDMSAYIKMIESAAQADRLFPNKDRRSTHRRSKLKS